MEEKHVVIGAAGALGSAIVAFLASKGKSVRAVVRDLDRARRILPPTADIAIGDGSHAESVRLVCRNATVIYHCVNVPFEAWGLRLELRPGHFLAPQGKKCSVAGIF